MPKQLTDAELEELAVRHGQRVEQYRQLRAQVQEHVRTRTPTPPPRNMKKTPVRMQLVLDMLAAGYSHAAAAKAADISHMTLREWKRDSPEFKEKCEAAFDAGTDFLEDEAIRRAVEGVDEPVFQGGEMVGVVRKYSDRLMEVVLVGRRPDYRKNNQQNDSPGTLTIKVEGGFVEDWSDNTPKANPDSPADSSRGADGGQQGAVGQTSSGTVRPEVG